MREFTGRIRAAVRTVGLGVGLFLLTIGMARAHDPGLSAVTLRLGGAAGGGTTAEVSFARSEAGGRSAAEVLELRIDGRTVEARVMTASVDPAGTIHYTIDYPPLGGSILVLRSPILSSLSRGHRQYVSIEDASGRRIVSGMLDQSRETLTADIAEAVTSSEGTLPHAFTSFLALGVRHILTGYDHLLFLLGLLAVGGTFRSAAKIITSFTVAHSITLAVAALSIVQIPSRVVEPLIAASIVYVGIENILNPGSDRRWLIALGFGLIHGFGFASALGELGIGRGLGAAIPLFSFNLGVELGQMSVAAIVLPLIWRARRSPLFVPRLMPACSALVAVLGGIWFVQRIVGA